MADSTPNNESIAEAIPKALGEYLLTKVPALREWYDEFPSAHRTIRTPSISIFVSTPLNFTPQASPNIIKKPEDSEIVDSKATVKVVVGQYDATLQLDLWTGSKEERDDLVDALFNALNPNVFSMGLVLEMPDYFNCLCDFLYDNHNYEDNEISSQTDEWRAQFDILISCKAVRESEEFIIEETDLQIQPSPLGSREPL